MMIVASLVGGAFIFGAFGVAMFFAIVWSYYTKTGSGITLRPSDGLGSDHENAAPGAEGKSSIAGKVYGEQDRFDTHGTR